MSETLNITDARFVQMEDIEETAEWCGGYVGIMHQRDEEGQHYIHLDDFNRAVTGSWIAQLENGGFISMTNQEYKQTFHAASKNREKFSAVFKVVLAAMTDGSADLLKHGNDQHMIAEAAALRIMELMEH